MIRITFISENVRSKPVVYGTDDTQEALSAEVAKWFVSSGQEFPEESFLFGVLIERDDARQSRRECAEKFRTIAQLEALRAESEEPVA